MTDRLKDDRTIHVTTVDQTTGYHSSGTPYTELRDVTTRYSDLFGESDLETIGDAEWEDRMALLAKYHHLRVEHANLEPNLRTITDENFAGRELDGSSPDDIVLAFAAAINVARELD